MENHVENQNKPIFKPSIEKFDVKQIYLTEKSEYCAVNELIENNHFKIEIHLGSLMSRKNMAFKQLVKKINYYFLLEFICVNLQEQGLWDQKLCNNKTRCSIEKIIRFMGYFLNLKKL
ncbi:MAG: hypothetical protein ACFFAH_01470 [Promethearchaeota archaeon]